MTAKKKMAVKTKSKKKPTQQPVAITLVPNDLTSAPGQLGTPDVAVVHRRVTDRLAKAKLQLGVGVLEVNSGGAPGRSVPDSLGLAPARIGLHPKARSPGQTPGESVSAYRCGAASRASDALGRELEMAALLLQARHPMSDRRR